MNSSGHASAFSMYKKNKTGKNKSKKKSKKIKVENIFKGKTPSSKPVDSSNTIRNQSNIKKHKREIYRDVIKIPKVNGRPSKPETVEIIESEDEIIDLNGTVEMISSPVDSTPSNSIDQGREMFAWMIHPFSVDEFIKHGWEKQPLHVSRDDPNYYKKLISSAGIDRVLRNEFISFTKNIDITSYENGTRETHNPEGRAHPQVVWNYYENGCSVRFLNPQTYIREVHLLNSNLQDFFNCFVGANVYLTPPNSQGFAPHYDDIEAFVLQVEGKKSWKIYRPMSKENELPRFSSKNFDQSEIGSPIMEVVLSAGDMLYFPRGFIHQAATVDGEHSLHITVSTYQKHTWADVFEKMIPKALEVAFMNDVEFRKGIPLDMFHNVGLVHFDSEADRRKEIINKMKELFGKLCDHLPLDFATDQFFSKNFMRDALPPLLDENERQTTVFGDSDKMIEGKVIDKMEFEPDSTVRLLRANILRLTEEEGVFKIYSSIENSKEYHGYELQSTEVSEDCVTAVATLIKEYPRFIRICDLDPSLDESESVLLVQTLWEKGLLMTEQTG